MQVCIVGRRRERLDQFVARACAANRVLTYQADLSRDEDLSRLIAALQGDLQRLDVLVHSAGAIATAPLVSASLGDFDRQYRTNVRAPYALTQAMLPKLRACQGQIVFINSSAGLNTEHNVAAYAASKHALKAVADGLRNEVNSEGIRVITVYPGRTATEMQAGIHASEGRKYQPENLVQPSDIASVVLNALALPRSAEVTDIRIRPMRPPA